jgi:hypothetical protein
MNKEREHYKDRKRCAETKRKRKHGKIETYEDGETERHRNAEKKR